jgi:[ribosomal protein S5]-alanine N-acetyltransferase
MMRMDGIYHSPEVKIENGDTPRDDDEMRDDETRLEIELSLARLRPWRAGDEAALVRHANNRKVWRNLRDLFPHPYTRANADWWIASLKGEDPVCNFAIEVDGEAAGGIGLHPQSDVEWRSAEIGYWLGEAHWGKGITTEAVREVTAYGFSQLDLLRIHATVFEWNPASMRVLEKAGYTLEGRLRKAITKDGQTIDCMLYAMIRPGD